MLQFGPTFERLSTLVDKARPVKKPRCLNPTCSLHGHVESTGIIRYGFYRTTAGKRRRYRCIGCGQTFSDDERHALLPPPASPSDVRQCRHAARRGGQSVGDCPDRTAGREHRRPLARAGCRRVSPLSPRQDHRLRRHRAAGRRDPVVHSGGRRGRRGCSRRVRSGRVSGRRLSSGDAAPGTPWRSFVTSRRA